MPELPTQNGTPDAAKLPLPARWQGPVRRAMADLTDRTGLRPSGVTPTRVEEGEWLAEGRRIRGLEIWLLAAGRSHRYRAAFGAEAVERLSGAG